MAYPTNLDSFTNPSGTSPIGTPDHASLHASINSAVSALESKVGINAGSPTNNAILQGSGNGQSTWGTSVSGFYMTAVNVGQLNDQNGNSALQIEAGSSTGNYLRLVNTAGTNPYQISVGGSDNNIGISIFGKGNAPVTIGTASIIGGTLSNVTMSNSNTTAKTVISSFDTGAYSSGATNYIFPCYLGQPNGTEANKQTSFPAGTITDLRFRITTNNLNGNFILNVSRNGSATTLIGTVSAAGTGVTSVSNDVAISANDLISIKLDTTAANSGTAALHSMQLYYRV